MGILTFEGHPVRYDGVFHFIVRGFQWFNTKGNGMCTGISLCIDCDGTQYFVVSCSFSFARPNGAGTFSMLVEIVFGYGQALNKSLIFG